MKIRETEHHVLVGCNQNWPPPKRCGAALTRPGELTRLSCAPAAALSGPKASITLRRKHVALLFLFYAAAIKHNTLCAGQEVEGEDKMKHFGNFQKVSSLERLFNRSCESDLATNLDNGEERLVIKARSYIIIYNMLHHSEEDNIKRHGMESDIKSKRRC